MSRKNSNKSGKQSKTPVVRTTVPAGQLAKLIEKSKAHTAHVIATRVEYPDPDAFDGLDLPQLKQHGFIGKVTNRVGLGSILQARGGKGKGKGGGGKKLPNPQLVLAEVQRLLVNVPLVGNEGPAVLSELNFEFLEASKAKYFLDSYKEIIPRAHVHFCVEVAAAGLQALATAMPDYTAYTSAENTRGQAVGFLVHKRFKVLGQQSYDDVATVQGIPDLRPAFRLDLEDTVTGDKFSVVVVHLKSMRGGPATTAPVRYQQCVIIAKKLGKNFVGVVGGDWNTFLGKTTDCDPLTQAGFTLVDASDSRATHIMGGRLDGFFQLNVPGLGSVTLVSWFATLKRDLTDHAMLIVKKSKAGK